MNEAQIKLVKIFSFAILIIAVVSLFVIVAFQDSKAKEQDSKINELVNKVNNLDSINRSGELEDKFYQVNKKIDAVNRVLETDGNTHNDLNRRLNNFRNELDKYCLSVESNRLNIIYESISFERKQIDLRSELVNEIDGLKDKIRHSEFEINLLRNK